MKKLFFLSILSLCVFACQKAPMLSLTTPGSVELSDQGGNQVITFTANRDWTASATESWCKVSPASGAASDSPVSLKVTCEPNPTYDPRTCTITIKAGELTETISFEQSQKDGLIAVKKDFSLSNGSQNLTVDVQANVEYEVKPEVDWIHYVETRGLTNSMIVLTADENNTPNPREGSVRINQKNSSLSDVITIKQEGRTFVELEAVDLGLGVKWANKNVGASLPEDSGDYYAWGEVTVKSDYSWQTYKYGSSSRSLKKYCTDSQCGAVDGLVTLESGDDVAATLLKGFWRMPTVGEFQELIDKCQWSWVTYQGTDGYSVTGPNGKSIFLPAAGSSSGAGPDGPFAYYWSSSIAPDALCRPYYLYFTKNAGYSLYSNGARFVGATVRAVSVAP